MAGMQETRPIAAATRMGPVELTVADLDRSLDFYRAALGLDPAQSAS